MLFYSFHYFRIVKGNLFTNCIAILLFTLILFKVSSFHVYTHQDNTSDDIENCSVCELAIENENTVYLIISPQILSNTLVETTREVLANEYQVAVTSTPFCYGLFGRPPPFIV